MAMFGALKAKVGFGGIISWYLEEINSQGQHVGDHALNISSGGGGGGGGQATAQFLPAYEPGQIIVGTNWNDFQVGGNGPDIILALGGDDFVFARGGDDLVLAGDGHDIVVGGFGNDSLYGDRGDDMMFGDQGHDSLFGGDGFDWLDGGSGNDMIDLGWRGGFGFGGDGNDVLYGDQSFTFDNFVNPSFNYLDGGRGNDVLVGSYLGRNYMSGGEGADIMLGGLRSDTMVIGTGDIAVSSGWGDYDTFQFAPWQNGNDPWSGLSGTEGVVQLYGADPTDTLDLSALPYGTDLYGWNGNLVAHNELAGVSIVFDTGGQGFMGSVIMPTDHGWLMG